MTRPTWPGGRETAGTKRNARAAAYAFGVASAVTSMIGIALVGVAIVLAITDAWVWAIVVGVAGSVLAGAGVVAVIAGAAIGATRRTRPRIDESGADDPEASPPG